MNYLKYLIKYLKHSQTLVLIIIIYHTHVVPQVSFFLASDAVPDVYNKLWRLLSFNENIQIWNTWENVSYIICKHLQAKKNLKIVKNKHQHTKTTEDEDVFWINARPPIEKHSNKDLDITIHL